MSLRGIMATKVGLLRHQLTIQSVVETQNSSGEPTKDWGSGGVTVKAAIMPLTGDEQVQAQQLVGVVTHRILIQYLAGVKPKMRGVGLTAPFVGSIFDFRFVGYVAGETTALEILAREVV
jgi:SPP1 family predicted phage head-tail adaptor